MIPNLPDYKIIKVNSRNPIGIHLKTTYTTPKSSILIFLKKILKFNNILWYLKLKIIQKHIIKV